MKKTLSFKNFYNAISDNSDILPKHFWHMSTEDNQIHDQESREFAVQTEQESSRESKYQFKILYENDKLKY